MEECKMANLSDNAKTILKGLQSLDGENITVHDLSERIGLPVNSITGTFNSFVKKGLGERVIADIQDGETTKSVKFLKLTEEGANLDADATEEA
jgi:DNA-binding MarR family transcriptional regulator